MTPMKRLILATTTLEPGKSYRYINYQRVSKNARWQKIKIDRIVKYIGDEGNKAVFETDQGSEILLHQEDVDRCIKEI